MASRYVPPFATAYDINGTPYAGGMLYFYATGTSTPKDTFSDNQMTTANANPVVADSSGRWSDIYLNTDGDYKVVLKDSDGVQAWESDPVSAADVVSEFNATRLTPTFVDADTFTVTGDQTDTFQIGRRVEITQDSGTEYGTVISSSYTTITSIDMAMDGGVSIDSGISAVKIGFLSSDNPAYPGIEQVNPKGTTHDFTSDADYTLTAGQEIYGRLKLTDTGTNLTTARNVVVAATDRGIFVQNGAAQILTVKTSAGTGVAIASGNSVQVYCDGTNVIAAPASSQAWLEKDAAYTASFGENITADTDTIGAFAITLPALTDLDYRDDNRIRIHDAEASWGVNNLTITPNGTDKIGGTAASMTVDISNLHFTLTPSNPAKGWIVSEG